ncbi:MAG: ATP synthase F1 subunit delta [Magnetococcales bacterium]|nr:ATP synthase F1 subunit delta [Magnetococcales bacterium]
MNENTLAKRYATALAELANERNVVETVGEELNQFQELLNQASAVRALLTTPTTPLTEQQSAIAMVLDKANPTEITGNFLKLLVDKRRMPLIDAMVDAYNRIVEERSGRVSVNVDTAKALTQTHVSQLETSFSEILGKEVKLEIEEKPDLLGGLVIQIGSVMIDSSVRNRLSRLKAYMRG